MGDFFQTGAIATLHRLGKLDLERMEQELMEFSKDRPIALVLPCHINDLGTRGLHLITRELAEVPYLKQIIVGIDGATQRRDWEKARAFFRHLPQNPVLLWNDGPRMKSLFRKLEENELSPGGTGKGRNVWICFGYALASDNMEVTRKHITSLDFAHGALDAERFYVVPPASVGGIIVFEPAQSAGLEFRAS